MSSISKTPVYARALGSECGERAAEGGKEGDGGGGRIEDLDKYKCLEMGLTLMGAS